MNNTATIAEILDKITEYTVVNPHLKPNLCPGLSPEELKTKLQDFPYQIPQEVEELYHWHDGINSGSFDSSLFYYHTFLPLQEALQIRQGWMDFNDNHYRVYPLDLLPIFGFEGEYYAVKCSEYKQDKSEMWFVYHDNTPVYDNLKSMLIAILECYQTGAYQTSWLDLYVDTKINEKQIAEIKLKYNPIRRSLTEELVPMNRYYYHP